jgi:hypothetical protein
MENINPAPGLDEYLQPLNMTVVNIGGSQIPPPVPDDSAPGLLASANPSQTRQKLMQSQRPMISREADRILRRERADVVRVSEKRALTLPWLQEFYTGHRKFAEKQILPVFESYAALVQNDIEREIGRPVAGVPADFIGKLAESFGRRHSDESLVMLCNDQTGPSLERAFGPSSRRAETIAEHESAKAGNAFASAIYKAADIDTMIVGTDNCDRSVIGRHPPLKDGCTCVVVAAGTTRTEPSMTTTLARFDAQHEENEMNHEERALLTEQSKLLAALAQRMSEQNSTGPQPIVVKIEPGAFVVHQELPQKVGMDIVYDKLTGKILGTKPSK